MASAVEERVALYLEVNRDELLDNWMGRVIVDAHDPYKELVKFNGSAMLNLVIASLMGNTTDEHELEILANKVSLERLKASINIGEFVYNVTIGRSEILNSLPKAGLTIDELNPFFNKINDCFDKFLYFAVQHYTELKNRQLEEQSSFIEQTHKDHLTILGQMSSSFVHEFRNPLTSIIGFVQLLQEKYPSLEYLDVLTKELNQLKYRINQFLLVSKKGVELKEREEFNVGTIFDETLDFLYPMTVSSDVIVEKAVDDSICLVGYRDEFRQVLINVMMNSLDALSECAVKVIRIQGYIEGDDAVLNISNNGPAISRETISYIFEPFVSTKKLGTGIGLYVCRKIVKEHHGTIECESNDEWTTFRIAIPIHENLNEHP